MNCFDFEDHNLRTCYPYLRQASEQLQNQILLCLARSPECAPLVRSSQVVALFRPWNSIESRRNSSTESGKAQQNFPNLSPVGCALTLRHLRSLSAGLADNSIIQPSFESPCAPFTFTLQVKPVTLKACTTPTQPLYPPRSQPSSFNCIPGESLQRRCHQFEFADELI